MGWKIKKKKIRWKKGSITVEASLLVPMAVSLCALIVFYCYYEHNRVWYTAAAYEAALVGTRRTEQGEDREALAEVRTVERLEAQPFPEFGTEWSVSQEKRASKVEYQLSGGTMFSDWFSCQTEASVKMCDPVGRVRTAWIAKKIMKGE